MLKIDTTTIDKIVRLWNGEKIICMIGRWETWRVIYLTKTLTSLERAELERVIRNITGQELMTLPGYWVSRQRPDERPE